LQRRDGTNPFCLQWTGELFSPHYLSPWGLSSASQKGQQMAWKAPKIVELTVGMEINMYMCATR
jgi:coenzyme PQQ precursor peptide PqqA